MRIAVKKMLIVLKHEMLTILRSKSFLLTLFLIPLVSFIVVLVMGYLRRNEQAPDISELIAPQVEITLQGLVDESGLIREVPAEMRVRLRPYASIEAARAALEQQEIGAFFLIPADYIENGNVFYYRPDFNPIGGLEQSVDIRGLIQHNLLYERAELRARVQNPLEVETVILSSEPVRDPESPIAFFLPYGVTFLFYIIILGSASLMLNSVTKEKQNRVMEILLTSMTPLQMMTGKIIALGILGLLQTIVWTTTGFFLLRLSGQTFALPEAFQLPPSIIVWGILFFVLGYGIYASLMAGVGALVPNLREASQATFLVILPMIVPLIFVSVLIQKPQSAGALFLSLFPLTSPIAMMTRLAATQVPIWQPLAAILLLLATVLLVIRSVAGMFRAQNLLSGQAFNARVFFRALAGRS